MKDLAASELLAQAWCALDGPPGLLERVRFKGPRQVLPSRLDVTGLAQATVGAAALAAAELAAIRAIGRRPGAFDPAEIADIRVDSRAAAVAFASEWHLRLSGRPQFSLDSLSRLWPTADGWIRTHANYPHHRRRLLAALDVPEYAPDPVAAVRAELERGSAVDAETAIVGAGGVAAAARSPERWRAHPQGEALAQMGLLSLRRLTEARPRHRSPVPTSPLLPAAGVRVLDFSRVIAGPVGTRTLAFLGADVLRVDSPQLPEFAGQHLDSDMGKRSTLLALDDQLDRRTLNHLIRDADVIVMGYRPAALDRFGLSASALLEHKPDLIIVSLSAWGTQGPWSSRRGFDSIVQVASGIAAIESGREAGGQPGALPVQALDHATGYLISATVLRALTRQVIEGGGWYAQLSLAQVGAWLMRHPVRDDVSPSTLDPSPWLDVVQTLQGELQYALPPIALKGGPRTWRHASGAWGADEPRWQDDDEN